MTIILDFVEQEELFTNTLGIEIFSSPKEKEELRKQLERDIRRFKRKGGKVDRIESVMVTRNAYPVGFNKEGMRGQNASDGD